MDPVRRRNRIILTLILLLAAFYRFTYLYQLQDDPLPYDALRSDIYDQSRFHDLALLIMNKGGGEALKESALYCPAYSFLIAAVYAIFDQRLMAVFVFQSLIGILAVYLMFKAGQYLFENDVAGLCAAAMLALYGPLVFYEGALLRASLLAYANLTGFYFLVRGIRGRNRVFLFFAGICIGLSFILRQHFLPLLILAYLVLRRGAITRRAKIADCLACGLAMVLMMAPLSFHRSADAPSGFKATGLSIFWIGNTYDSSGIGLWRSPLRERMARESEGSLLKTALVFQREIREHPGAYARLYARKLYMLLNAYEIPANLSYDLYLQLIPVLGLGFFDFWWILPLALPGLILLTRRGGPQSVLLCLFIGGVSLGVLLFHVQGRYRIPLVPFLILAAGWMMNEFVRLWHAKNHRLFFILLSTVMALTFLTAPDAELIRIYFGGTVRPFDYTNWAIANTYRTFERRDELTAEERRAAAAETLTYTERFFDTPQPLLQAIPPEQMHDKIYLLRELRAFLQKSK